MTISKSEILIIVPAYNEAAVISKVIDGIRKAGYTNILVVDDGSFDNTKEILYRNKIQFVSHPINRGAGAAVQTGIELAKKKGYSYVLLMDADGQHLPEDIESLVLKMEQTGADIIIGNRFSSKENKIPTRRILYNKIANALTNILSNGNFEDTQSGFRLLNRRAIEKTKLKSRGFDFCSEMLIVAKNKDLKIDQVPIQVLYTEYSMNKGQNIIEGFRTARSILWHKFFEPTN